MKYSINAPAAIPWAPGNDRKLIFASGQVAVDPHDPPRLVDGGVREQTDRIIQIFQTLLDECGCSLSDVAQTTLYLTDLSLLPAVDEVYARRFPTPAPARSVVQVAALPLGAVVEMDCIACR